MGKINSELQVNKHMRMRKICSEPAAVDVIDLVVLVEGYSLQAVC